MPIQFYLYCSLELHIWKNTKKKKALKQYYDEAALGYSGITKLNEFPAGRELTLQDDSMQLQ